MTAAAGITRSPKEARAFLELLDPAPDALFTFQTFDDSQAKRRELARILHGQLTSGRPNYRAGELDRINRDGAGVFVCVNATDGKGREHGNVVRVRALFVDLDGSPLEPVLEGAVVPHLVVESSPGRWHAYWLVDGCELKDFKRYQQALAARFSGDRSVNDLPRVMRVPGFVHAKGAPFVTRIAQVNERQRYAIADLVEAFDLAAAPASAKVTPLPARAPATDAEVYEDLRDALRVIPADEYDVWIRMGHALKTLGDGAASLWIEWSAKSAKFNFAVDAARWATFHPDQTDHRAVFAEAKRHGWDPRSAPTIARKRAARSTAKGKPAPDAVTPPLEAYAGDGAGAPPPPDGGGEGGEFDFSLDALREHFTLIYPTVTAFDHRKKKIVGLQELRAAAGRKRVDIWLKDSARKIVDQEDVVFEPGVESAKGVINLFRGLKVKPAKGDATPVLRLLAHLCGEADSDQEIGPTMDWVLKWFAFPLQHIGAKMESGIVIHGPEGAGKNMFTGVVRKIYGEYGVIITQAQLDNKFNGWASAKLFVIGNEVLPRAEVYQLKQQLKNMITEPEWQIEEKHVPSRAEANHANFVFLSNVLQPVAIDQKDRRYMVIWTPTPAASSLYVEVGEGIRSGRLVEAFYRYLLDLDLGDFNEHTKPPLTDAKRDLIELSMDSPERFFIEWRDGDLTWPFQPAISLDLYHAYRKWCDSRGERALSSVKFVAQMKKTDGLRAMNAHVVDEKNMERRRQRCFVPVDWTPGEGHTQEQGLGKALDFFRASL